MVPVDATIVGCPVEKRELLLAIASLLRGDLPLAAAWPVCAECRMRETICLLERDLGQGNPALCLGALTAGGCGARCPAFDIGCSGCRGPSRDANVPAALAVFARRGVPRERVLGRLATFAPVAADGSGWGSR